MERKNQIKKAHRIVTQQIWNRIMPERETAKALAWGIVHRLVLQGLI